MLPVCIYCDRLLFVYIFYTYKLLPDDIKELQNMIPSFMTIWDTTQHAQGNIWISKFK